MNLAELMEGLDVRVPAGHGALRICDINEDSRTVMPGSLFIARGGAKADGKAFAADAVRAGAVAVLTDGAGLDVGDPRVPVVVSADIQGAIAVIAERFYGNASRRMDLVGVTGTNGKTTTTYLLWQLLNGAGRRCGLIGTVVVDDGTEVAPANMTTPPAIEVSRSLARMDEAGCTAASLEVSSHALHQKRADALRFRVGVFTNLTGDHLDYHGTMEEYAGAKARLFSLLPADGLAVVNTDDPWSARVTRHSKARIARCTLTDAPGAECAARVLDESIDGMRLHLRGHWGEAAARVPLIGRYNAMNILQAAACAHELGMSPAALESGIAALRAPPGRLERVTAPGEGVQVFVDYAHSDDSLRSVLGAVAGVMPGRAHRSERLGSAAGATVGVESGRLWVVFGCGGDRDRTKRPRMGRAAAEAADMVVVTSDNPRTERPSTIVDEILTGIDTSLRHKVTVQVDRARAIRHAIEQARAGDVVVIAGKGHETEQIVPDGSGGTIRTHFDDREVAREVLAELRAGAKDRKAFTTETQRHTEKERRRDDAVTQ